MNESYVAQTDVDLKKIITYLINLIPLDVINIITREPEINNYDYIKSTVKALLSDI